MKKIIDFFKRLFGLSSNKPLGNLSFNPAEEISVVEPLEIKGQPFSKTSILKQHFLRNLSISKKEAKNLYGIISLSKFIYKLRKRGMRIVYNENTKIYTYEPKN
jgi:hypothetical protein